jgi:hypothetical protein
VSVQLGRLCSSLGCQAVSAFGVLLSIADCCVGSHLDSVGSGALHAVQQLLCHLWCPVRLHKLWQDGGHRQHLQWPGGAVTAALHILGPTRLGRELYPHQLFTGVLFRSILVHVPPCSTTVLNGSVNLRTIDSRVAFHC